MKLKNLAMILIMSQNNFANSDWKTYVNNNPWQMPKYEFSELKESPKSKTYKLPKIVNQIKSINNKYKLDKRIKLGSEKEIYPLYYSQKMDIDFQTPFKLVGNLFGRK